MNQVIWHLGQPNLSIPGDFVKKVSDNSISPAPTAINDMITNNAYAACKADQSHSLLYHPF
jgi:hypothetical protein